MHNNFPGKADSRELEHFLEDLRHVSAVHLHCLMEIFFKLRFPEETNKPNGAKNRSGQCGFENVLGDYYRTAIRDSVNFKRLMTKMRIRHLPVINKDQIVNIISISDLIKNAIPDR